MNSKDFAKYIEETKEADKLAWEDNDQKGALKAYLQILESNPRNVLAYWRIGQIYYFAKKRNLVKALTEFRKAIKITPDWSEGYLWCANTLAELGKLDDAVAEYQQAIRFQPNDSRNHIMLGRCLSKLGRYKEAIESFRKGISFKPSYGEIGVRMMLARTLNESGRLEEAIKEWQIIAGMEAVWDYEKGEPEKAKALIAKYSKKKRNDQGKARKKHNTGERR